MSSGLSFDNKKYISAKEASSLTGYSRDYIGQLVRSKKIDSKRVGHVWYVGEESILKYNNLKKYISAKEAGSLTGYSRDYIGQLARSKKIDSKRVGRVWYVSEESILKYNDSPVVKKMLIEAEPVLGTHTAKNTRKEISSKETSLVQEAPFLKKYRLSRISSATPFLGGPASSFLGRKLHAKILSKKGKLFPFTFGLLLIIGIFYISDVNFPNILKNISSRPEDSLSANLVNSLANPTANYTSDSLASDYKDYVSPSTSSLASNINGSDLFSAFKNYISQPTTSKPKSLALPTTPSIRNVSQSSPSFTNASLLSALRILLSKEEFADQLRGPEGAMGPQGPQGSSGMYAGQPVANLQPSAPAPIPLVFAPVGVIQPNPGANFSGATLFSATNLSSNSFSTSTANIADLTVSGSSSLKRGLNVTGDASISGDLSVGGKITSSGDLTLHGVVTLDKNFSQTGTGTFSTGTGAISLNGATSVTGENTFSTGTGLVTLGGDLTSVGNTTLATGADKINTFGSGASSINTIGSETMPGALTLHGATTLDNNFSQTGENTFSTGTGDISLNGDTTITADKNFSQVGTGTFSTGTGAISLNGVTSITSTVPTGTIFSVTDNAITDGTLIGNTLTANADNGQFSRGQTINITDATVGGGGFTGLGINVTGAGTGSGAKYLLDLNPNSANNEVVFDNAGSFRPTTPTASNTATLGSSSFYWKNIYTDQITANNIAGVVVGGATSSTTWTIGSTQAGDVNEALIFQRNSGGGNATLQWNAGANDLRYLTTNYPLNTTYTVADGSIGTGINLLSGDLTNNTTSGTQKLLSLTNTGTGTTENGIYINNTGTGTTALEIAGTWTNGIVTNNNSINAGSGAISGGAGSFTTLTSSGNSTIGTGASLTNTFGTGTLAANTIGAVGGTNAINGATTILGTTLINSTGILSTTMGNGTGTLTLHGATTLDNTFSQTGANTFSTGTGLTTLGGDLTVTGTAWTATPTISGLVTATSGLTSNGAITIQNNSNLTQTGTGTFSTGTGTISLNGDTTVDTGKTFTVTNGTTNITGATTVLGTTLINSTGTAATTIGNGTGTLTLHGATSLDNTFSQTGANTFSTGTGDVSLNGNTSVIGSNTFTVGTGLSTFGANLSLTAAAPLINSTVGTLSINTTNNQPVTFGTGTVTTNGDLTSVGNTTLATGANKTNTFGTGTAAANTFGESTGTNAINGATTILGTTLINSTGAAATTIGNATGVLTVASGGVSSWTNTAGNLTIQTVTSGNTTLDSAGILNLGTINSTATNLGKAATTLTINPTDWIATPTISGLITATSGLTSNGNVTVQNNSNLTQTGTGTFSTGTGTISLNGDTTIITGKAFTVTNGTTSILGATSINTSGSNATNIGTGTSTGIITIGNATVSDLALNDAQWSITGAGAATFSSASFGSGSISGGAGSFATLTSSGNSTIGTGASLTNTFGSGASDNNTIGGGASSINTIGSVTAPGVLTLHGTTILDNNFSQSGAFTFSTGTGNVTLNGPTSVTGTNTFSTGTGNVSLNGATTVTGANTFSTGTGAVSLNGDTTVAAGKTLTATTSSTGATTATTLTSSGNSTIGTGASLTNTFGSGASDNNTIGGGASSINTIGSVTTPGTLTLLGSGLTVGPTNWTATPTISGLITANAGIAIPTGQNITGAGTAQVTGFATVSATNLTGTLTTTTQNSVTTMTGLTTVGALNAGSITSGFGAIDVGADGITTSGTIGTASTTTFTGAGATFSSALAANGGITFDQTTDTVGAHTLSGTLDANTNILTNIGNAGTDFIASTGALTLAGVLTSNGGITNAGAFSSTGGIVNLNASSNYATNIGTGTSTGIITIGNANSDLALNDAQWSITGAGAATFSSISAGSSSISGGAGSFITLTSSGNSTIGTGASLTNTFGTGTLAANTIGAVGGTNAINGSTTVLGTTLINSTGTAATTIGNGTGTLTLHGATTLDNAFTVSGSNLTSLGGNLTVIGTAWTATPTISGLITATSGLTSNGAVTVQNNSNLTQTGTGTFSTGTGTVSLNGPTTANNFASSSAAISGGTITGTTINNSTIGITTAVAGNFTTIGATTQGSGAFSTLTSSGNSTIGTGASLTNTFGSGASDNNTIGGGASSINTIGSVTAPGALTLHGTTILDNNFSQSGAFAFSTGTGNVYLNGATFVTGTNTFSTGTGNVSLNGPTTVTGANTFTTGTGAVSLNGDTTVAAGKTLTATTSSTGATTATTLTSSGNSTIGTGASLTNTFGSGASDTNTIGGGASSVNTLGGGASSINTIGSVTTPGTLTLLGSTITAGNITTNPTLTLLGTGLTTLGGGLTVTGTVTANTFSSSGATITGGTITGTTINNSTIGITTPVAGNFTTIGATTAGTGAFTTLSASAIGDALTLSGAGANIYFSGAGVAQIKTIANQNLALMPGGTGNVGIGISTPQGKLDVNGTGLFRQTLTVADTTTIKPYSSFGTGVTTHGLSSAGDVLFSNNVEIDGNLYLDSGTISIPTGTVSGDFAIDGVIKLSDGSATSPAYTFTNDNDVGMYRVGTNILGFTTAGTNRLTIDATGLVTANNFASSSAAISGGTITGTTINNSTIGITTPVAGNFTTIGATTQGSGAFSTLTSNGNSTIGTGASLTNTFGSGASDNNTIGGGASSINTIGSTITPGVLTLHGATTLDNTFSQTGANTFSTGTGAISLNGATTITGANTFATGTGAVSLNGPTTVTGANTFSTGTGAVSLNGDTTVAAGKTLTATTSSTGATTATTLTSSGNSTIGTGASLTNTFGSGASDNNTIGGGASSINTIGSVTTPGTLTLLGSTITLGNITTNPTLTLLGTGLTTLNGGLTVAGAVTFTTDLTVANGGTGASTATTINGTGITYGTTNTITAAAGTLTGATLASGVTASSLTSVGILTGLTMGGNIALGANTFTTSNTGLVSNLNADLLDGHDTAYFQVAGSYEAPLTFTNGLTRTANDVHLGGTLSEATTITQASNAFTILNSGTADTTINLSSTGDFNVQDNGTSALFVRDNGNVGIGTTSPVTSLHVAGTSGTNFSAATLENLSTASVITKTTSLDFRGRDSVNTQKLIAQILSVPEDYNLISAGIAFNTRLSDANPAERMRITSAGNVGIGTTAPTWKLTVGNGISSTIDNTISIVALNNLAAARTDGKSVFLNVDAAYGEIGSYDYATATWKPLVLSRPGAGNVGIGTTNPGAKLELQGTSAPVARLGVSSGLLNSKIGAIEFRNGSDTFLSKIESYASDSTYADQTDLRFYTTYQTSQERLRITSLGNVGIGTTNPASMFSVGASNQFQVNSTGNIVKLNNITTSFPASQGAANSFLRNDGAGTMVWADPAGTGVAGFWQRNGTNLAPSNIGDNVGIGTTAPSEKLHVTGTVLAGTAISTSGSLVLAGIYNGANDYLLTLGSQYSSGGTTLGYGVKPSTVSDSYVSATSINVPRDAITMDGGIRFLTAGTQTVAQGSAVTMSEKMTILNSGNIGIGNTAPAYKLDVTGDIRSTTMSGSFVVGGNTSNYYPVIFQASNLGGNNNLAHFEIFRDYVHTDGSNYGSFRVQVQAQPSEWGNRPAVVKEVVYTLGYGTYYNDPVGDIVAAYYNAYIIVWLKGGGTYGWRDLDPNSGSQLVDGNPTGVTKTGVNGETWTSIATQSALVMSAKNSIYTAQNISTGGNALFAGNVGIGTIDPGSKLQIDVAGSSSAVSRTILLRNTAGYGSGSGVDIHGEMGNTALGTLRFIYGTVPRIELSASDNVTGTGLSVIDGGNVGIGTTTPGQTLDVVGNIHASGWLQGALEPGTQGAFLNGVAAVPHLYYSERNPGNGSGTFPFNNYGEMIFQGSTRTGYNNGFSFVTGSAAVGDTPVPTVKVRIDEAGNVGIGTTAPGGALEVNKDINQGTWLKIVNNTTNTWGTTAIYDATRYIAISGGAELSKTFNVGAGGVGIGYNPPTYAKNGADALYVNGNVGIGTMAPLSLLAVGNSAMTNSSAQNYINLYGSNSATNESSGFVLNQVWNGINYPAGMYLTSNSVYGAASNELVFKTSYYSGGVQTNEQMRITNTGNVGIGTTGPLSKLTVYDANALITTMMPTGGTTSGIRFNPTQVNYDSFQNTYAQIEYKTGVLGSNISDMAFTTSFLNSASEKMRILGNGNVGIGTTAPLDKLNIANGNIRLTGTIGGSTGEFGRISAYNTEGTIHEAASISFLRDNGGDGYLGALAFNTSNNAERMRITSNGNVGIGTTNPKGMLHIQDTDGSDVSKAALILAKYWASDSNTRASSLFHYYDSTQLMDKLVFGVAGTGTGASAAQPNTIAQAKMVIQANGNVGIGTTGPNSKLEIVNGTANNYGDYITGNSLRVVGPTQNMGTNPNYGGILNISSNDAIAANTGGSIGFGGRFSGTGEAHWAGIVGGKTSANSGEYGGYLALYTRDEGVGLLEKVRITGTGNVGIGTTGPGAKLEVSSANTGAGILRLRNTSTATGAINGIDFNYASDDYGVPKAYIHSETQADWGNKLYFGTATTTGNASTRMTIDNLGNVGIGTTSPGTLLEVSALDSNNQLRVRRTGSSVGYGDMYANSNGLSIVGGGGANILLNPTTGNVGIGTTAPNNLLQVAGLIDFNNTDFNTKLGYQAGKNIVVGAQDNTFVGYQAGLSSSTASTNAADNNSAFGYQALFSNTSGGGNTANGAKSLYANTTGTNNTANGYQSLDANTSGGSNTANGYNSLTTNTTGNSNTATGLNALYSNISGYENTATGLSSLYYNTAGYYNVATGVYSLYQSTGNNNTANGYATLSSLTTGNNNTATGYRALELNTTGSNNTADGYQALDNLRILDGTGNNTAIGYKAGLGIMTGINNTIIGANVTGLASTLSNTVIIADGSGNRRIYADSSGNVGIGTTVPTGKLHVVRDSMAYNNAGTAGLVIGNATTPSYQLYLGYDTTLGMYGSGFIQSTLTSAGYYTPTLINPNGGSVGIGETSPGSKLSVLGGVAIGSSTTYSQAAVTNGNLIVQGNVGIGTTNTSAYKLAVNTGTDQNFTIFGPILMGTGISVNSVNDANTLNLPMEFRASAFDFTQGNVGIGRTTPLQALDVNGNINFNGLLLGSGGTVGITILSNGNVGIGTAGPVATLDVFQAVGAGRTAPLLKLYGNGGGTSPTNYDFINWGSAYGPTAGGVRGTEVVGSVWGTQIYSSNGLSLSGNGYNDSATATLFINSSGNVRIGTLAGSGSRTVTADSNGTLSAASDERLKNIEGYYTTGLAAIDAINPISYTFKPESGLYVDRPVLGFSAQNVQSVIPQAVGVGNNGFLTLDDRGILATSVNAIKELNLNLNGITGTITPLVGSTNESFVTAFFKNIFAKVTTWLADAGNGISDIFAGTIHAKNEICIGKTCVNETQLQALLLNVASASTTTPAPVSTPDPTPTCVLPQTLVNNVCTDPTSTSTPTSIPEIIPTPETTPAPESVPAPAPTPTSDVTPVPTPETAPATVVESPAPTPAL